MSTRLVPWNWFGNTALPSRRGGADGNPALTPVDELHNEIDRLFQSVFRGFDSPWSVTSAMQGVGGQEMQDMILRPRLDLTGDDKAYTVTVELPGVEPDAVSLEVRDNALILHGEKKQEHKTDEKGMYRMERAYGSFERVLPLPEDAQDDAITASHKDGVLTISIPRKEETEPTTKKIAINKAE